jgi:hypothetical protein
VAAGPFPSRPASSRRRVRTPEPSSCVSLDVGEAEAITLAEEIKADIVLIDEMAGRETARISGFTVLGTLGLLLRAKRSGLLPSVAPLLDRLRSELNFFISDELRRTILRQAEE